MSFFDTVVRRRVMTTVLVLVAVILGALAYGRMGLRSMPEIEFPMATVTTVWPGGSPLEVETEITKRIEDAVSSISGIEEITSYSQQSISQGNAGVGKSSRIDQNKGCVPLSCQVNLVYDLVFSITLEALQFMPCRGGLLFQAGFNLSKGFLPVVAGFALSQ